MLVFRLHEDFPGSSYSKESACNAETCIQYLGQEDTSEKGMVTHSSVLAWIIPWTEEPGELSPWSHKESDITKQLKHADYLMWASQVVLVVKNPPANVG